MIQVIVAEDEPLARSRIVRMLKTDPDIEIIAECKNGPETLKALKDQPSDLLFLDVQMPEMNGFEVLGELNESQLPRVIFVTAYEQYALQAFEMYALDYLLKPFHEERLRKSLQRAKLEIEENRTQDMNCRVLALLDEVRSRSKIISRVLLKEGDRAWFLKVDEIDWIEAETKYVRIHTGKQSYLQRQSLSEMESCLDPAMFTRIHRSAIVNVDHIREIRNLPGGESRVILRDGTSLAISRTYRKNLMKDPSEPHKSHESSVEPKRRP